ncbi:MAG: DUF4625 domain-containing protein [Prevotellaceae bacterium]|jgi:hypothetical protein|nr:DUF4625 domain-containing protein [Prevotellaceae bacterium]
MCKFIQNGISAFLAIVLTICCLACVDRLSFSDEGSLELPQIERFTAEYLWIGPDYKLAVEISVKGNELQSVQLSNGEWMINKTYSANGTQFALRDTFMVSKDANRTEHEMNLVVKNSIGGLLKAKAEVNDLSAVNQIEGYNPDLLPPVIVISSPTVNRFYGLNPAPIPLSVQALITEDEELVSVYLKVWGETSDGTYFESEHTAIPANEAEKTQLAIDHNLELPGGIAGEYQFLIKATDQTGNQSILGGNLTVGMMDRLYLSDAKNDDERINQGYDSYAAASAWGLGTLVDMRKTGNNLFTLDYYYRNEADENIRFIAFMGNDRPFGTSSRTINYTLDGQNVIGHKTGSDDKLTANLAEADFKLPVSQAGYYTVTVDMTARTVSAVPLTPINSDFSNAALFPNYSVAAPYDYLAIISGGAVVGTSGWAEIDGNTKLTRETQHPYIYSGEFTTVGGANISFTAPKTAMVGNTGWFRLPAARANIKDSYGDLVSAIKPVGASSNGANYGISLPANKNYYATYDLITYRLRIIQKP